MRTREVCATSIMVATCLATNYALSGLPNIKLMDFLVFASGLLFGPGVGVSVALLTWAIYGTLNPYGFSFPILLATATSETIYGLAGSLLDKHQPPDPKEGLAWSAYKMGVLGFSLTALYDLMTNLAFAITFAIPIPVALVSGIYFSLVHEVSNALIFSACSPALAYLRSVLPGPRERAEPCGGVGRAR